MADDETRVGAGDRRQVAAGEACEVGHLASKHGLSTGQARNLIARFGNDRTSLDAAAASSKS